jgi:hypothetical protein
MVLEDKVEQGKTHHLYLEHHHNLIMDLLDHLHFLEEAEPVREREGEKVVRGEAEAEPEREGEDVAQGEA